MSGNNCDNITREVFSSSLSRAASAASVEGVEEPGIGEREVAGDPKGLVRSASARVTEEEVVDAEEEVEAENVLVAALVG